MRLIVNADDLGLSLEINAAIEEALRRGWCSSTSLMANGPAFDDAVKRLRGLGVPAVGVHLNLSEGEPLSDHPGLEAILDGGRLSSKALQATPAEQGAIAEEWQTQIDRVRGQGLHIDHLNSHQHLHHRPLLREVMMDLMKRNGIRRLRTMGAWRPGVGARGIVQWIRARHFRRSLRRNGLLTTDEFMSVQVFRQLHTPALPRAFLMGATIELMAHPGNPHAAVYAEELRWLADGGLQGLPLLSWTQLR